MYSLMENQVHDVLTEDENTFLSVNINSHELYSFNGSVNMYKIMCKDVTSHIQTYTSTNTLLTWRPHLKFDDNT